jgi:hypothetical protein
MKPNNFFKFALGCLLITISTNGCSSRGINYLLFHSDRIPLRSDEQMVADFQRHKPESIALMKQCASEPVTNRGGTNYAIELFLHCNSKTKGKDAHEMANYMASLNLQNVSQKFTEPERPSKQFKGVPYLFMVQQIIYDDYDTMVEEKGYIFSAIPIETNVLTTGSLSQFERGLDIRGRKDMSEIWRFKQIEPNWYLYYRHFFRPH